MVASMLAMAVGMGGLQASKLVPTWEILAKLSQSRRKFEGDLVYDEKYDMKDIVYSMILSQKVLGFWPVGRSDRRFLYFNDGYTNELLYQQREGDRVQTKWLLELEKSDRATPYTGTMVKYLKLLGLQVAGKVSKEQAAILNEGGKWAGYGYLAIENAQPSAWLVNEDGACTTAQVFKWEEERKSFWPPISDYESEAMGLGREVWPQGWSYQRERLRATPEVGK